MSTKNLFFQKQDKLLSELPHYTPASSSNTFRTHAFTSDDPELYMGDDSDSEYKDMLMHSDLLAWLKKSNNSVERLRLILEHFKYCK